MSVKGTDNPSCYSIANERPIYTSFILVFIDVPCNHALSQHKCCWPGGPRYTRQLRWGMPSRNINVAGRAALVTLANYVGV